MTSWQISFVMRVRTGRLSHGWFVVQPLTLSLPLRLLPLPLYPLLTEPHESGQWQHSFSSLSLTLTCRGLDSNAPILRAMSSTSGVGCLTCTKATAARHSCEGVPAVTIEILRTILAHWVIYWTCTNGVFWQTGTGSWSFNTIIFQDMGTSHWINSLWNSFPKSLVAKLSKLFMALWATLAVV